MVMLSVLTMRIFSQTQVRECCTNRLGDIHPHSRGVDEIRFLMETQTDISQ